jgi:hypothetical protein
VVVRRGTKIRLLRNDSMLPDRDLGDAVERCIIANPAIVSDCHVPREGDANPRSDQNITADLGPEQSPSKPTPTVKHLW